ncbi:MAG: hypothetical protein WAO52_02445 [Prolixibacteraceae bacterium]
MESEIYKLLLGVAGFLIVFLLGIIGFFLQKHIKVIELLVTAVNSLDVTVRLLKNDQDNAATNCQATHQVIATRLNAHSTKLQEHGIALTELKTKSKN